MCKKLSILTSFALVLGMAVSMADADITTGLVSHWKLDETSGTIAKDSAGDNDGTLMGDATWTEGWIGGAVEFDGEGDYIDCGNSNTFDIRDAVTLSAWVKPDPDFAYPDWSGIIHKGSAVDYDTFAFYYKGPTKELGFKTGDTSPDTWYPIPAADLFDRDWHHVAAVYDGTTKSIYLDSEVIGATGSTGPIRTSNGRCLLGAGRDYNPPTHYFVGKLDDARIYGRALTAEEVQQVMIAAPSALASNPNPADAAIDVPRDVILSWMPGEHSDTHDVYFGTVFDDVNDASRTNPMDVLVSQNQDEATYDPLGLLEYGQRYYWRVDEFNDLDPNSPWKGDVWSFRIINYFIVDDFESYNDLDPTDPNSNRIFLTWVDGFDDPANGSLIGYPDPPFAERRIVHGGKQSMPFFYDNNMKYSEAQRTLSGSAGEWTRERVDSLTLWFRGHPAYVGSFVEGPVGTYTMTGSGTDIWGTSDEFHFAYKEHTGAAAIIAKVESVGHTDPWAKAGVMIRDTLEADSRNTALLITPEHGVRSQHRKTTGGKTDRGFVEGITAPQWVRLERTVGGLVRAYYSADGATWTLVDMKTVSMNMPVYIGLAVTSHNVDATCEAKFSHVGFPDTSVGLEWTDQDIGMLSNEAEPMYVVLNGSAVVYHEDPGATQIDTWREWNISLQGFADQGVDLTNVNTIGIGFGDRNNPQRGGSGLMYFDDIRLYLPR